MRFSATLLEKHEASYLYCAACDHLYVDHPISFATAALGGEVKVRTLDGELKLKVRSGTQSHTLIRLRNEGVKRVQGNGRGDLYVRLVIRVPEKLSREEKKIVEQLQVIENEQSR